MTHKPAWKTGDKKQKTLRQTTQEKNNRCDRTKSSIQANPRTNSEHKPSKPTVDNKRTITNPFSKLVTRHYGSFKTKMRGNPKRVFEDLKYPFTEKAKLGTTRRKYYSGPSFSLIVYSSGTIEIKPSRACSKSKRAGEVLSKDFWENTLRKAESFLSSRRVYFFRPVLNRRPKYGVEDKTAKLVKQEVHSEFRSMDRSPGHGHVDNWGLRALNADNRLSSGQHFALAKERLRNPELLASLEAKMDLIVDSNVEFAKNLGLHLKVLSDLGSGTRALSRAVQGPRPFRRAFKNSATVRGVC